MFLKVIREHLNTSFKKLLIDQQSQFEEIKDYVEQTSPEILTVDPDKSPENSPSISWPI